MPIDGDVVLKAGLDTTGISDKLQSLQKTISKGLKNAIRIGFGVRSVFALIRKLRSALVAGFGDLAQVHQPFNQAVSDIMNALQLLRNSFASAFAPIIEVVSPILTKFITMIANAVSVLGQFIAMLTGKEYVQAASVQRDYAASLDKSASSSKASAKAAKQQNKAAKELKRTLAGFDDVEILKDKDKDTSSGGTPTGGSVPTAANIPIGDAVKTFAKDFMAAWEKADFTDFGRLLGDKLNAALNKIPWDKIKNTVRKIASSIATFLNGFLETPGLFSNIGRTIAEALNTGFAFAEEFVKKFHWNSLGKAIRDLITGVLSNIDWKTIYSTMSMFGTGLATYLNNLITPDLFKLVGASIARVLNSALKFLDNFGSTFDWRNFGKSIATGINSIFQSFNFNQLAHTLNTWALGILTSAQTAISNIHWADIGTKIANFLNNIRWREILSNVGTLVADALSAALDVLINFGQTFDWTGFGESLASGINSFLREFNPAKIGEGARTVIIAVRDAIIGFVEGIQWYELGFKIRDTIKNLPWKLLFTSFGIVVWKAINGVVEFFAGLFDVDNITGPFADAFQDLQETISGAVDKIDFEGISSGFNAIVEALKPAGEGFAVGFISILDKIIEVGIEILNAVGPALQAIADAINSLDPDVTKKIGEALGIIAGAFVTMSIITNIVTAISKFVGILGTMLGPLTSAIGTAGATTSGFLLVASVAAVAYIAIRDFTLEIADTSTELNEQFNPVYQDTAGIIETVGTKFGLTKDQIAELTWNLKDASEEGDNAGKVYEYVDGKLEAAGVNADVFKQELKAATDVAEQNGKSIDYISGYLDNVTNSADESSENVTLAKGSLDSLNGVEGSTSLKLGLIALAISWLSSKGKLSQEQVEKLQGAIGDIDTTDPQADLSDLSDMLDDAKISSTDFYDAVVEGAKTMGIDVPPEFTKIQDAAKETADAMPEEGKNIGEGVAKGITESAEDVEKATQFIAGKPVDVLRDQLDMHSPSVVMQGLGADTIQGFINGISEMIPSVSSVFEQFTSTVLDTLRNFEDQLDTLSYNWVSTIQNNFSQDWYGLGSNIGEGIYNGLFAESRQLEVLAWNTAVDMYNSACRSLGIASPSKKFAWVGSMITAGLQEGIVDNADKPVDAVNDMVDAITDSGENANIDFGISTSVDNWIDTLEDILGRFSDTVVTKFDTLVAAMESVAGLSYGLPAVAQGKVVPSGMSSNTAVSDNLSELADMFGSSLFDRITPDDLRSILADVLRENLNISFYLGDEQVAKHANAGNLKLNRRYGI